MLKLKEVGECLYPESIGEAVNLLKERGDKARIVGGGLHLSVFPNPAIKSLIFLNKLKLNYTEERGESIAIGATTTISELAESHVMKNFLNGKVKKILDSVASELLRNQITIGGSIAQREPYSDIATLLLALEANIVYHNGTSLEKININDFYAKNFREMLKSILIKEVELPKYGAKCKFGMERFVRNATDIPLLNLAVLVYLNNGTIEKASVVAGARPGPSERFVRGEEFLHDKPIEISTANDFKRFISENIPVEGDVRVGKDYRKHIAGVFAERIIASFMGEKR